MYEDAYTYCICILISIPFVSLYITIRKMDSMAERFINESFGHTIGSHKLLVILVRSFHLSWEIEFFLVLKSLIKTTKSNFIQINHFD